MRCWRARQVQHDHMIFSYIRKAVYLGFVVALFVTATDSGVGPNAWLYAVAVNVLSQLFI